MSVLLRLTLEVKKLKKELDWRIQLCNDRLRSMENKDEKIESLTKELASWNEDLEDIEGAEGVMRDEQITSLEHQIKSLIEERDGLQLQFDAMIIFKNDWKEKSEKLEAERDEYLEIVNKYEDAQGLGIQTIIEQSIMLEKKVKELEDDLQAERMKGHVRCTSCGAVYPEPHTHSCNI